LFLKMKALLFLSLLLLFSLQIHSKKSTARYSEGCKDKKVQIFSDVDDTIKAAGTNFVAGCDGRWLGGSIYAGMPQFYLELGRTKREISDPENIGIVSARPERLGNKFPDIEKELNAASKNTSLDEKWGKIKKILPGEIDDNLHVHTDKRFKDYADTKFKNVKNFVSNGSNNDLCIIFIGDNGQGDQLAGVRMLKEIPSVVSVFIHNVTANPTLKVEEPDDLFIFKTYPEAAYMAYQNGFISKEAVARVIYGAQSSIQYGQCEECLDNHDSCDLKKVKPHYYKDDGGCRDLFEGIQYVANKLDLNIDVPDLDKAEEDSDGMGFFGFFFKIVIPLLILGGIGYGVFVYSKVKKDVKKKDE
jgi:hypothetical protein